jgi:hypothetical protein
LRARTPAALGFRLNATDTQMCLNLPAPGVDFSIEGNKIQPCVSECT